MARSAQLSQLGEYKDFIAREQNLMWTAVEIIGSGPREKTDPDPDPKNKPDFGSVCSD